MKNVSTFNINTIKTLSTIIFECSKKNVFVSMNVLPETMKSILIRKAKQK